MGCDIHMHVEVKTQGEWVELRRQVRYEKPNGWWGEIDLGWYDERNYCLFTYLAGVRKKDGITPISLPRGLPEDVSESIANFRNHWGEDGHSTSWLDLKEIPIDYGEWLEDTYNIYGERKSMMDLFGSFFRFREELECIVQQIESAPCRLVFWFDN